MGVRVGCPPIGRERAVIGYLSAFLDQGDSIAIVGCFLRERSGQPICGVAW